MTITGNPPAPYPSEGGDQHTTGPRSVPPAADKSPPVSDAPGRATPQEKGEMNYGNMTNDAAETKSATWHPKETAPMDGKWCWASDGKNVWIVNAHTDGTLRSDRASAVRYWTRDFIPEPPEVQPNPVIAVLDDLDRALAENARLQQHLGEATGRIETDARLIASHEAENARLAATSQSAYERELEERLRAVTERLDAMTALLGDAMKGLKPFATIAVVREEEDQDYADNIACFTGLCSPTAGQFRNARALANRIEAALKPKEPKS